ncbi:MAG: DUF1559 domain-containing protein [Planctomyces sp.]|nr:DUF1559 domain-containing protein [Planctomyces sp.]
MASLAAVVPPARRARGMMQIEVLIVLLVAGAMLGLMLPAMQTARQAARRVQCMNNLKQIGVAMHTYHGTHDVFPPGYVIRDVQPGDPASAEHGPGFAWGALLLPNLDQSAMAATIDFNSDATGITTRIPSFNCPNDDPTPFVVHSSVHGIVSVSASSFVGVFGFGSLTDCPGRPESPGVLFRNSRVRIEDVADGLSQTFMLGERRQTHSGEHASLAGSTWYAAVEGVDRDGGYPDREILEGPASLVLGTSGQTADPAWRAGPNGTTVISSFSSAHAGGAHFLKGDGSVGFIANEIDVEAFRRMTGIADSATPGGPTF